jgi:hypothetical protein
MLEDLERTMGLTSSILAYILALGASARALCSARRVPTWKEEVLKDSSGGAFAAEELLKSHALAVSSPFKAAEWKEREGSDEFFEEDARVTEAAGLTPPSSSYSSASAPRPTAGAFGGDMATFLNFFGYVLSNSGLTLTTAQAECLWDECVESAVSGAQRSHALAWFTQGVILLDSAAAGTAGGKGAPGSGASPALFSAEVACHLFESRLNTPHFSTSPTTNASAFIAWRVFFLFFNSCKGALSLNLSNILSVAASKEALSASASFFSVLTFQASAGAPGYSPSPPTASSSTTTTTTTTTAPPSSASSRGILVLKEDFPGLSALWDMCLNAHGDGVARDASTLLTSLATSLDPATLASQRPISYARYVAKCLHVMHATLALPAPSLPPPWPHVGVQFKGLEMQVGGHYVFQVGQCLL